MTVCSVQNQLREKKRLTVRIITRLPLPCARPSAGRMRRAYIYPHRSVRSWRSSGGQIVVAVATAAILITFLTVNHADLFRIHHEICVTLLSFCGISAGATMVDTFPGFSQAPAPTGITTSMEQTPAFTALVFGAALFVLMAIYAGMPMLRGFLLFLMVLLVLGVIVTVFLPGRQMGPAQFAQVWLRGEFLVWLLLPVFAAATLAVLRPSAMLVFLWTTSLVIYGFLWSAVRLAFFTGVISLTGFLFVPAAWFAFGLLADMVYFMVFYSLAVHWTARRAWRRGSE